MTVDVKGQPEMARAYQHLNKRLDAGKGDAPRNNTSLAFRRNYDRIFGKRRNSRQPSQ